MRDWLKQAGEEVSAPTGGHQGHGSHANHELMRGMATPEQMAELAAANGTAFDRQFLSLMMEHHKGAVTMVEELHRQPGTAYDPVVFNFTNDVVSDQNAEISRMNSVLAGPSTDPRATTAAGFRELRPGTLQLRP